jgi:septum formation protein
MLILGSNSETRAQILRNAQVDFIQKGCDFDEEQIVAASPKSFVWKAVKGKLSACINKFGLENEILVADTVISVNGAILRKAKNPEEAKEQLRLQSGNRVSIITAMILKGKDMEFSDISEAIYEFSTFPEKEIQRYLDSGEWKGKAGSCMIEGFCKPYIISKIGLDSCAMGLTIEKLLAFTARGRSR